MPHSSKVIKAPGRRRGTGLWCSVKQEKSSGFEAWIPHLQGVSTELGFAVPVSVALFLYLEELLWEDPHYHVLQEWFIWEVVVCESPITCLSLLLSRSFVTLDFEFKS